MPLQLQAGKYYRTADGKKVLVRFQFDSIDKWVVTYENDDGIWYYRGNGANFYDPKHNIVAEWEEPKPEPAVCSTDLHLLRLRDTKDLRIVAGSVEGYAPHRWEVLGKGQVTMYEGCTGFHTAKPLLHNSIHLTPYLVFKKTENTTANLGSYYGATADPHDVAIDAWGRDSRQYEVYVKVPGLSNDITQMEQQLRDISRFIELVTKNTATQLTGICAVFKGPCKLKSGTYATYWGDKWGLTTILESHKDYYLDNADEYAILLPDNL